MVGPQETTACCTRRARQSGNTPMRDSATAGNAGPPAGQGTRRSSVNGMYELPRKSIKKQHVTSAIHITIVTNNVITIDTIDYNYRDGACVRMPYRCICEY
jgi:hypothetical protein